MEERLRSLQRWLEAEKIKILKSNNVKEDKYSLGRASAYNEVQKKIREILSEVK